MNLGPSSVLAGLAFTLACLLPLTDATRPGDPSPSQPVERVTSPLPVPPILASLVNTPES